MAVEYKVGAVASILSNKSSTKKKRKSTLFDDIKADATPVFKPFTMEVKVNAENGEEDNKKKKKRKSDVLIKSTDEEMSQLKKKKKKKMVQSENVDANDEKSEKPSLLMKREKGLKRADDEIQRRKEKKLRKKEEKRKLQEMNGGDNEEEPRVKKSKFESVKAGNNPEAEERTIFVGNLPITMKRFDLKKLFSKFGPIDSVRIRSAAIPKPDMSKRVAVLRQEFHPERSSINGFVVFEKQESALKSLEFNGTVHQGHHIRVDLSKKNFEPNHKHSVFVGNLSFKIEEEDLWNAFEECGKIQAVRIIRDKETGVGKGFGYVTFQGTDSVELALKLSMHELKGRKMRVSRSMKRKGKDEMKSKIALDKQSKKKNKGKSFVGQGAGSNKFQGVTSKEGLKLKLAKKNKTFIKKPIIKKKKTKNAA